MFTSMLEHTLLQMFWQVIWDDESAFDNALGPRVGSCKPGQGRPMVWGSSLACVAMAMAVILCFLYSIDLVCHGLNVLSFVGRDLFNALVLPMNVFPAGHGGLVFAFIRYLRIVLLRPVTYGSVCPGEKKGLGWRIRLEGMGYIWIDDDAGSMV